MNTPNEFEARLAKSDPAKKLKTPVLSSEIVRTATRADSGLSLTARFWLLGAKFKTLTVSGAVSGVAAIAAVALVGTMSPQTPSQMTAQLGDSFASSSLSSEEASREATIDQDESTGFSQSNGSVAPDVNSEVSPGETALQAFLSDEEPVSPGTSNYIIVFKPAANIDREVRGIGAINAKVGPKFQNVFKGVMAKLTEQQFAALSRNPNISFIEKDATVSLVQPSATVVQSSAPWGLDRIDQVSGRDSNYTYSSTGAGVTAYVIDTGIMSSHSNFGGRVSSGFSSISGGTQDCNGHGTHVAGTIGAATYGVAKAVSLVPVRVLDCNGSGTVSGVIAGIDWVASQASGGLRVANMSLGGVSSSAIDSAVNALINKGVTVVVAAGNNGANACNYSPARVPAAITVAASTSTDGFATYSNRGSCVDIIAPGSSIQSTWHTSSTATNVISGTSMASPHVAGTVALLLQQFGFLSPAQMDQQLKSQSSRGIVSSVPAATVNLLLFTAPQIATNPAPAEQESSPNPNPTSSPTPTLSPSPTPTQTNPGRSGNNPRRP